MSSSSESEEKVEEVLAPVEIESSGEDPPMSEWSSLIVELPEVNKKRVLAARGLYSPGSGEVCGKYIAMSDSDVFRHHYYNYPAVLDPGITEALLEPELPVVYHENGQDLYLALCNEMNTSPIRMFHSGLLTDKINLCFYGVDPNAVRTMTRALQYNKTVQTLDLTDNFLNGDACFHLAQLLLTNVTLKELILEGCRIGSSGLLRLGSTLSANRSLESLNLARNCLGEKGGEYLVKQISEGASVPRLGLSYNELGRLTAFALAEVFEYRNKFTHLDLSWNNFFHAPSTTKMLEQLSMSDFLEELDLSWNALEGDRIAGGIKELLYLPTLTVLNLSNNRFKDSAIVIISGSLIKSKKLSVFDLSFNPLSVIDANVVLEKMLKPRVKIETLLLDGIPVDKTFVETLKKIQNMKSRKTFSVTYDRVLGDWTVCGPDSRKLVLERANYLGTKDKKRRVDIGVFFLQLEKEYPKPIDVKEFIDRLGLDNVPLDEDLIVEIANLFPGPKTPKSKTVNIQAISDYVRRLWPDKKRPVTPPPEPEPELEPVPPPVEKDKKKKKK